MIISFFIDRLQYTTRFTLRNSFEVVLIHSSIISFEVVLIHGSIIVDAIWVDLLQRNFFVFTDRVAQVEKENQQLAAQNVALRRYIEDVQGKGDLA